MIRILCWFLLCIGALSSGCSAITHPRPSATLDSIVAQPRRIAILKPRVNTTVKYISTPEFFFDNTEALEWARSIKTGMRRALESDGHKIYEDIELAAALPRGELQTQVLNKRLTDLTAPAIVEDADYSKATVPVLVTAEGLIPPQLEGQIDLIIATTGRAKIETIREFYARWFRNIGFNLLTFPITAASAFIPVPLPLSVTISTSIFEPSPEDIFVTMIVVDVKTKKIVFQNDYYSTSVPADDTALQDLGVDLLDGFLKDD